MKLLAVCMFLLGAAVASALRAPGGARALAQGGYPETTPEPPPGAGARTNGPAPTGAVADVEWKVQKYAPVTVAADGGLRFRWAGAHSLWEVPKGGCPSDFGDGRTCPEVYAPPTPPGSAGNEFLWVPGRGAGEYWLACSVDAHCRDGMLLKVTVQ